MDCRSIDVMRENLISGYHFVSENAYHLIVCVTSLAMINCFSICFNTYHDPHPCSVQIVGLGTDDLVTTGTNQGVLQSNFQSFGTAIACVVVCVPSFIDTLLDMLPSNIFSFCYNDRRPVLKLRKAEIIRMTHFERILFIVGIWMIPAAEFQNAFIGDQFSVAWSSRLVVSFNSGSTILIFTSFLLFSYRMSTFFTPISSLIISILLCCSQTLNLAAYRRTWIMHNCPSTDEQKKSVMYAKSSGYFLAAFIIIFVIKGLYDLLVVHKKQKKLLSSYQSMELQVRNSVVLAHLVASFIGLIYHVVAAIPSKSGAPIISDDPQAILKYRVICLIMAAIVFVTEFRCRKNEVTRSLYEAIEVKKKYIQYVNAEIKAPLNVAFLGIRALRDDIQRFPTERDDLHLEIVQEIQHGCLSVSQVINGLLRLEQLELLDHMPSLGETQLVKQTKPLHSFLVHCVTSVTTQHAQERNVEVCLDCSPARLDIDNNIIFSHDVDLLMELTGTDVITADQMLFRQAICNVLSHAVAATPVGGTVTIQAAFLAHRQPTMSEASTNPSVPPGGSGNNGAVMSRYSSEAVNDVSSVSPSHDPIENSPRPSPVPEDNVSSSPWTRIMSFFQGTGRRPVAGYTTGDNAGANAGKIRDGRGVLDAPPLDLSYTRFIEDPSQTSNTNDPPQFHFRYRSVDSTRYPLPAAADDHEQGLVPPSGRDNISSRGRDEVGHLRGGGNAGDEGHVDDVDYDYDDKTSMSGMVSGRLVIQVVDGGDAGYDAEGLFKLFEEDRDDDDDDRENVFDANRQGLSITKAIVEMHGGKISAMTSEAGGGTVLTIQLPMKRGTNVNSNPSIGGVLTTSHVGNVNAHNHANASLLHRFRSKSASVFSSCDDDSVTITAAERRLHQVLSRSQGQLHGQGQRQGQGQRVNFHFNELQGSRSGQSSLQIDINNCIGGSQQGGISSDGSLLTADGIISPPVYPPRLLDVECGYGIKSSVSAPATARVVAGTHPLTVRRSMEILQPGEPGLGEQQDV